MTTYLRSNSDCLKKLDLQIYSFFRLADINEKLIYKLFKTHYFII